MEKQSVIIIGAGVAGLMAAAELVNKFNVIILEAAGNAGGRIRTIHQEGFSGYVEAGAEFIHGEGKNTRKLLKDLKGKIHSAEGKVLRKEAGKWKEEEEFIEGWDKIISQMKKEKDDLTLAQFLDKHFSSHEYSSLRKNVRSFAEGFDLADAEKVSIQYLYNEWSAEVENARITGGYDQLIKILLDKLSDQNGTVHYNKIVKQVDWEKGEVTVYTADGSKYDGEKVIITVPVSILQRANAGASINFTPPIDDQIRAANKIGFGTVIKIVIEFKVPFWEEGAGFILSDEMFPTWWTQFPDKSPILTGWCGGPKAILMAEDDEQSIKEKALHSLASLFELSKTDIEKNITSMKVFNWQKEELAFGSYSYEMPGSIEAKKVLNEPLLSTVFFAGEALYSGDHPGTVEAALESGIQVARKVRQED